MIAVIRFMTDQGSKKAGVAQQDKDFRKFANIPEISNY